jgi:hypothetical protein
MSFKQFLLEALSGQDVYNKILKLFQQLAKEPGGIGVYTGSTSGSKHSPGFKRDLMLHSKANGVTPKLVKFVKDNGGQASTEGGIITDSDGNRHIISLDAHGTAYSVYTYLKTGPVPGSVKAPTKPTLNEVMAEVIQKVRALSRGSSTQGPEQDGRGMSYHIRDWGSWQVPDEAGHEEDYDWKELDPRWRDKMNDLFNDLTAYHMEFNLRWSAEEKNWITITVVPK